jgi:hypothetical protein
MVDTERAGWASLPAELQLQVLGLLPGMELPTLRLVAAGWRDLADDPPLRAKFHLVVDAGIPPKEIQELVAIKRRLVTVTLQDHQLSQPVLQAMVEHPSLATVHLRGEGGGTYHTTMNFEPLYRLIFERQLAAAWLGPRLGGRGPPKVLPTLYICARRESLIFKLIEEIYEMLKL